MKHGEFTWCDLSAHNAAQSRLFYSAVFGWKFKAVEAGEYHSIFGGTDVIGGHFQMPEKFIKIGMPAFWMSYICVDDVAKVAAQAIELGGKVELGPKEDPSGGVFALIRDPLGAGFTIYSGAQFGEQSSRSGMRMGHGLFVSDAASVQPFYEALFGWHFGVFENGIAEVTLADETLFRCHEIADPKVRGKEEFWAVYFACDHLGQIQAKVDSNSGVVVANLNLPEGTAILARDPDGGAFIIVETAEAPGQSIPWKAWCGLGLMLVLATTDTVWPWVIFFAAWVIVGIRSGETYLFERISRVENATFFWILMAVYTMLGLLCLPNWGGRF